MDRVPNAIAVAEAPDRPIPAPRTEESRRLWLLRASVAAAVVVLLIIAAAIFMNGIGKHDLGGSYLVVASDASVSGIETTDSGCRVSGATTTTSLSVEDGAGTTLASTTLGQGRRSSNACEWRFTLTGVPEVSAYVFKVDGRRVETATLEQLRATNWTTVLIEDVAPPPADLSS